MRNNIAKCCEYSSRNGSRARLIGPALTIDGRKFLHGLDVTESYRDSWARPIELPYDAARCDGVMNDLAAEPVREGAKFVASFVPGGAQAVRITREKPLEQLVDANTVFSLTDELTEFTSD